MQQTNILVIGASVSGLACSSALQKNNLEYIIIEKEKEVGTPWRRHYERLHLHTNKRISNLPYKKFDKNAPRYPSRQQVVDYLDSYQNAFNIQPLFDHEALCIKKEKGQWITHTTKEIFQSKYIIIATGLYNKPKPLDFKGMESFPGRVIHSCDYKTGKDFKGEKVLVVGFGNSACEIAIDLFEQGALPSMSVRSPVNVVPRDLLGVPILELSLLLDKLPPRFADKINAPLSRLLFGDLNKLGLRKKTYGPYEEIRRDGNIPLLDIGTLKHIRKGYINIFEGIHNIEGNTVIFNNAKKECFDAIVASIGYSRDQMRLVAVEESRFEDLKVPVNKQNFFWKRWIIFLWLLAESDRRDPRNFFGCKKDCKGYFGQGKYFKKQLLMQAEIFYCIALIFIFSSCNSKINKTEKHKPQNMTESISFKSGYSKVNGLNMYYEIYGEGKPLVLIHGGGSTIQSTFGRIIPLLAKTNKIIAVELQAHGRTSDRDGPETFEQDADDVAALLKNLDIQSADFFGFSNGANTTMRIATRHPELVNKLILGSGFYKRDGMIPHFWEGLEHATIDIMPQQLKDAYKKVAPDPTGLQNMFNKDVARMRSFKDWPADDLRSIKAPALIICGDKDIMTPEHAVEMYRLIPNAQLAILPGSHGKYIGVLETLTHTSADSIYIIPMIDEFLDDNK